MHRRGFLESSGTEGCIIVPGPSTKAGSSSPSWVDFANRLASVLEGLGEGHYLIVSSRQGNHFVQFAGQGTSGMRVETTSNAFLETPYKLSAAQVQALLAIGWLAPTGSLEESTQEKDLAGSPNFNRDYPAPVPFHAIAELTVHTFADILGVARPTLLTYSAFKETGGTIICQRLGLELDDIDGKRKGIGPHSYD